MTVITIPDHCLRCGQKLKNYSQFTVTPHIVAKKKKGKLIFPYSQIFYFCEDCVGDFDVWIDEYSRGSSVI